MKISIFSARAYDREFFSKMNRGHELVFWETHLSEQSAIVAQGSQVVCAFVNDCLSAGVLSQLKEQGVQMLALRSAGYNHLNLESAKALGLVVARVPAYSPHAVAEHALALLLTLNRKIHKAYNRIRDGNFSLEGLVGFDIFGKTVGVVGTGQIGKIFARTLLAMGARVLCYDVQTSEDLQNEGAKFVTLEELFSQSDIISLHCPLVPQTRHLINGTTIEAMKTGVVLLNTGRGGLIETSAVIQGLKSGKLGGLALDVYEEEANLFFEDHSLGPIQDDSFIRLMTFPNVLITGHQAFLTHEALVQIAQTTFQNIEDFERGRRSPCFL